MKQKQKKNDNCHLLFEVAHILPGGSLLSLFYINCVSSRVKLRYFNFSSREKVLYIQNSEMNYTKLPVCDYEI